MNNYDLQRRLSIERSYLLKETDDSHFITVNDIRKALEKEGIFVNRKTIYYDLHVLEASGLDIIPEGATRNRSYHVGQRDFEDPEIRFLIDCIQSSNFIPIEKSKVLIDKLMNFTNRYFQKMVTKYIFINNRVKSETSWCYINVDVITRATENNHPVRFKYFRYNEKKEKVLGHNGDDYLVSPLFLVVSEQNYYMVGHSHLDNEIRHYRIDRMQNVTEAVDLRREGKDHLSEHEMETYANRVFCMFNGEETIVRCRFHNSLSCPVLDRFGLDLILVPDGLEHFIFTTGIKISPQFYAWMLSYGDKAEILGPPAARDGIKELLRTASGVYSG